MGPLAVAPGAAATSGRRPTPERPDHVPSPPRAGATQDMNWLVMNYLVTEGYVDAAAAFQQETGTAPGVQLGSITDRMAIRRAVQAGDVVAAVERVNDLNPEVRGEQCQAGGRG